MTADQWGAVALPLLMVAALAFYVHLRRIPGAHEKRGRR